MKVKNSIQAGVALNHKEKHVANSHASKAKTSAKAGMVEEVSVSELQQIEGGGILWIVVNGRLVGGMSNANHNETLVRDGAKAENLNVTKSAKASSFEDVSASELQQVDGGQLYTPSPAFLALMARYR